MEKVVITLTHKVFELGVLSWDRITTKFTKTCSQNM